MGICICFYLMFLALPPIKNNFCLTGSAWSSISTAERRSLHLQPKVEMATNAPPAPPLKSWPKTPRWLDYTCMFCRYGASTFPVPRVCNFRGRPFPLCTGEMHKEQAWNKSLWSLHGQTFLSQCYDAEWMVTAPRCCSAHLCLGEIFTKATVKDWT